MNFSSHNSLLNEIITSSLFYIINIRYVKSATAFSHAISFLSTEYDRANTVCSVEFEYLKEKRSFGGR
jgi:hypothetical protein